MDSKRSRALANLVHATSVNVEPFIPMLVTVPNVQILETGEDWETSTGIFTFTEEDLVSAIESQEDPGIRTPVLKLGHIDPRFDGQPSFGRLENMHLTNNNQTLVADLVGVPQWLASVMWSAYPRRSIEGTFAYSSRTGNDWPFILTGLALLGDAYPAINTLEDIQQLWGVTAPELIPVEDVEEIAASGDIFRARRVSDMPKWLKRNNGTAEEVSAATGVKATTSIDDVRMQFYDQLDSSQMWWWIRAVLVNPLQLVVDDDAGGLYLIDVTVDASDEVTYGEPQAVKVEYVSAGMPTNIKDSQIVAARYEDAAASGGKVKGAEGAEDNKEEGEHTVLTDDALRALGLEPGATEEQISAAIVARATGSSEGDGNGGGDTTQPETQPTEPTATPTPAAPTTTQPDGGDGGSGGEGDGGDATVTRPSDTTTVPAQPTTPVIPEGMVLVDQAQWDQTQEGVAAALRMDKEAKEKHRDTILAGAVQAGKFPKARLDHYKTLWASDPKGTEVLISNLAAGAVPVELRGTEGETDPKVEAAYPDSWKHHVPVAASRSTSTRVRKVND